MKDNKKTVWLLWIKFPDLDWYVNGVAYDTEENAASQLDRLIEYYYRFGEHRIVDGCRAAKYKVVPVELDVPEEED